jgi:hypothetical protein
MMSTLVHVSPSVYSSLGLVVLRIDTSGDPPPGGLVSITRREVGYTVESPVVAPAGYASGSAVIRLVNGSAIIADTTVPLDVAIEYLAGLPGETLTVAAGPVTLLSGATWRLGDPLRPYLDLALTPRRTTPVECPTTAGAKIILGLTADQLDLQSEIGQLPGNRNPLVSVEPIASPSFEVRFATRSQPDREAAEALFAPGGILLLRAPATYQFRQRYLIPTGLSISRVSSDHRKPWRVITVQARECSQPPGASYGWLGTRWQDLCSGGYTTWAALAIAGLSWGSMGTGVVGGGFPAAMRTWTEVDSAYASWGALTVAGLTWSELLGGA